MTKKLTGFLIFVCFIFLFASPSFSATLRWGAVASTAECTIAGYKIHYGTESGVYTSTIDAGDTLSYNLDLLALVPAQTYYFAVSAYSTTNFDGELSSPVPYRDAPEVVGSPVIDYTSDTIDITFNESTMQGAFTKGNYTFSPSLLYDDTRGILLTDKTYRLYMDDIPEHAIINITLSNITDNNGNDLIDNTFTINDDDNDGMADDWEADYGISSAFSDADSDGIDNQMEYTSGTNPLSSDSDNDGMDDAWEIQNSLNPLVDDTDEDSDGDGITNLEEYLEGTGVSNKGPEKPGLILPTDGSVDASLTPSLQADAYVDTENDAHLKTQWQISTESTFTVTQNIVFELESHDILTTLDVPEYILDPGKTYYWRLRFFDIQDGRSQWSDAFSFDTLAANPEDGDNDGMPDIQQVPNGTIDLNDDKIYDVASDTYKMVENGNLQFAMEASSNVQSIECLKFIDPNNITDNIGKPSNLPFGLLEFRIAVNSIGDSAMVRLYFSEPVGPNWYKYDLQNGWTDYSGDYPANVQLSSDGKSILLRLVDGGAGDSDGVANGVIVDPSGPGAVIAAASNPVASAASSGGGSGCFIATAAFGSQLEKHVQILRNFRDFYLLKSKAGTAFVRTYYKYSPPIADVIAKNTALRAVVRVGLMPLIAYGYAAVYLTPIQQCAVAALIIGLMSWTAIRIRRYLRTSNILHFNVKKWVLISK